jgi:hypothetical protein
MSLFTRFIIRLFQLVFFSRNSIFLSQQISQQCFSAGLSAQPNGANINYTEYGIGYDSISTS